MGAPKEWPPLLMGYDVAEEIRVVRNGQGVPATQPIPPDAQGHVPGLDIRPPYDPAAARALLDKFGYRDRHGDGWRVLHIGTTPEDRGARRPFSQEPAGDRRARRVRQPALGRLAKMAQQGQLQVCATVCRARRRRRASAYSRKFGAADSRPIGLADAGQLPSGTAPGDRISCLKRYSTLRTPPN